MLKGIAMLPTRRSWVEPLLRRLSNAAGAGVATESPSFLREAGARQPVKLHNSLTKAKEPLPRGQPLTWYTCGPTVYDHAHIGHARAYVALDIVRRVLVQQGYCVFQVMGMTDIDDKIIAKAAEQGLSGVAGAAMVARRFEAEFLRDMAAMHVLPPDAITRVTDYLPEIVQFVRDLEAKGFAYRGAKSGTLWFDTVAYGSRYGVLEPSRGFGGADPSHEHDDIAAVDREAAGHAEKKNFRDFALWKPVADAAVPGWDSALGRGRPGWHIECSAFCRQMFGETPPAPFLHSGGRDLRFPHHENEIAQSQALLGCDRWVQHWLHAGQLTVEGLKMSKSLKNYTSIQDHLAAGGGGSARRFRLFCLLHRYSADVSFGPDRLADAAAWERALGAFFRVNHIHLSSRYAAYEQHGEGGPDTLRWDNLLADLHAAFLACQQRVQASLEDDIDTPAGLRHLRELMTAVQRYQHHATTPSAAAWPLLSNISFYVLHTLESWGVDCSDWVAAARPEIVSGHGPDVKGVLDVLLDVRQEVRELAVQRRKAPGGKDEPLVGELLSLCDRIRDTSLPALGVRVQDKKATKAVGGGEESERALQRWFFDSSLLSEKD